MFFRGNAVVNAYIPDGMKPDKYFRQTIIEATGVRKWIEDARSYFTALFTR